MVASGPGAAIPANFYSENLAWYVSPVGNDANDCLTPDHSCQTLNGPLDKPGFAAGDSCSSPVGYTPRPTNRWHTLTLVQSFLEGLEPSILPRGAVFPRSTGRELAWELAQRVFVTAVVDRFAVTNSILAVGNSGSLDLSNCSIYGNFANDYSTPTAILNVFETLTLTNCTVTRPRT